jgi:hypothetical protein
MGLGCPISQTWTPHRQDNLNVVGATVSSIHVHVGRPGPARHRPTKARPTKARPTKAHI